MEQMPKIPYLTADKKGRKLRRNVPADLRDATGKTAWVQRVAGKTWAQIKQEAHAFGLRTELEISRLRQTAELNGRKGIEPGFTLSLDESAVVALGLKYFHKRDATIIEAGGYIPPHDTSFPDDIVVDANLDLADADRAMSGQGKDQNEMRWSDLKRRTFQFLVDEGWAEWPAGGTRRVPEAIRNGKLFEKLCHYVARADREIARRSLEAATLGRHPSMVDDWFRSALVPEKYAGEKNPHTAPRTLAQLTNLFLDKKKDQVGPSRKSQFHVPVRALHETLGEMSLISSISREQCQDVADLLIKVPAHTAQHHKGLSLAAAAEAHAAANGGNYAQRHKEAKKSLDIIRSIFELGVYHDWLPTNPFAKVHITIPRRMIKFHREDQGYEPFDMVELAKIFSAPLYVGCLNDENGYNRPGPNIIKRHRYWAPLLSLWTGMRMNEILQLERSDIQRAADFWYISVNDEATKSLKTKNAFRNIPVHPELERLGFIEWVLARPSGPLFPEAVAGTADKPSGPFSKRFANFLKSCGIWEPRRKVFHSFRNNFNDALRTGGVPREFREIINGWSSQKVSEDDSYGSGHRMAMLYGHVSQARYDGLDLSHLYSQR